MFELNRSLKSVGTYSYSYTDAYGDTQTRTYDWGGERNFIEHVTNFFDSDYSCMAIQETNYVWHGGHTGHSRYSNPDNKFHTTTSFDIDTGYGSIFCNPHTLDSRKDISLSFQYFELHQELFPDDNFFEYLGQFLDSTLKTKQP